MTISSLRAPRPAVVADTRPLAVSPSRIRRFVTIVGVIAVLVLGYGSIRAAAAWTAASAPLAVAPVPVATIQDRLAVEQARSDDLRLQLETLSAQSTEMTAGLEAAQAQIASDTDHATALAKELKDAKKKLAKLEASIAKAKRAPQHVVVVTRTATVSSPSKHAEDEGEGEHGDD
jgi:peptidoglycan hydrolase CwlO-like protein